MISSSTTVCPYKVIEACSQCWINKKVSEKHSAVNCCWLQHEWRANNSYILMPKEIELRPLPTRSRSGGLSLCSRILHDNCCTRRSCSYAHSEEELQVWRWMANHQGKIKRSLLPSVFAYNQQVEP